ncbi:TetR/AcrR family transcriptional regulator C-terminal domain-containing protein [Streptomyces sp. NPDC057307]|uniref:TetR/AcrR family transcriptional regulator C-terminal domain-containing protein n=1 Tax=Streptomyces sp. NPDC057307 TaxID=3346096 RepID=UPI003628CFD6
MAAELRRRIASGDLLPGDRVPSTRRITEEWGVAMATASKALAALNQEGLVRAVPGVGTVVAEPDRDQSRERAHERGRDRGRGAAPGEGLSRERVVRAAIALADVEGLGALSMRRVATEFGTSTMALYRHVPSKGELVRLMSEAVFGGAPSGPEPVGWRPRLTREIRWLWTRYERHPWLARAMAGLTRPMVSPHAMSYTERVLTILRGLGLTPHGMIHTHLALFGYAQGLAMAVELESQARQDTGMTAEEWMAAGATRPDSIQFAHDYPVMSTLFGDGEFDLELGALFDFGLERMLDGVESLIARSPEP